MKKVININFQGRVIPIEEVAFDQLKNYIDSLQRYFSNEEGKDEIINDIESRIAELFSEILKKGAPCIVEDDVTNIIHMMGRVEDFEAEDAGSEYQHQQQKSEPEEEKKSQTYAHRGRFYRDADDQIIGGVCSGLANYMGVDPVLVRIIAVVFFTFFFWIYLLLWLIVPSQSSEKNITKRLFRDLEDKWIGGVCSGIANFFNASSHLVRLLFGIPFAIWFLSGNFRELRYISGIEDFPNIITGSIGLGLAFIYVVLWIALPVAKTTTDKLEMRGEKIDVNNIQKKVKEDLEGLKGRSAVIAEEVKEAAANLSKRAKEFGSELEGVANKASQRFSSTAKEASENAKKHSGRAGSVLGGFFKVIGMLIAACFAFVLFASLLALTVIIFMSWPYVPYFYGSNWQLLLMICTVVFFILVPLVALVIYLVKRLSGSKPSKTSGIVFSVAWTIGWICLFSFIPIMIHEFQSSATVEEKVNIVQPQGTMVVNIQDFRKYQTESFSSFISFENEEFFLYKDSLAVKSGRLSIIPTLDSNYSLTYVKVSKGNSFEEAYERSENIPTRFSQVGNEINLSNVLLISKEDKFRAQHYTSVLKVPIGKDIIITNDYSRDNNMWIRQNTGVVREDNIRKYLPSRTVTFNEVYRMTEEGLKSLEEIKNESKKEETPAEPIRTKIRGEVVNDTAKPVTGVYEYPG